MASGIGTGSTKVGTRTSASNKSERAVRSRAARVVLVPAGGERIQPAGTKPRSAHPAPPPPPPPPSAVVIHGPPISLNEGLPPAYICPGCDPPPHWAGPPGDCGIGCGVAGAGPIETLAEGDGRNRVLPRT